MKTKVRLLLSMVILAYTSSFGQVYQNTKSYNEKKGSPNASMEDIRWIQGLWRGEAFGGKTEEVWTPPLGNSMMCAFKLVVNGKIKFYEITTITEENETLLLRLKHFHGNLKGWEERDVTQDFRLVEISKNRIYFEGFTFERISTNEINIYVVIGRDEEQEEVKFNYKRVNPDHS